MARSAQKPVRADSNVRSRGAREQAHGPTAVRARADRKSAKGTQEERLIDAMIELCAELGYLSVSVADVSTHAGVSSKTFYALFEDKEDCLLAAYRAAASRLLANVQPVAEQGDWREAAGSVLERLLLAVQEDPAAGRLLLVEALAGGARVRKERERVLSLFEQRAQQFLDSAPRDGKTLDLPATAVVGAVRSLVSRHLRTHGEDRLALISEDFLAWLESYSVPVGQKRWSTGPRSRLPASAKHISVEQVLVTPARLPRGRHRLPAGVVARSQRTRIIHGTAEVMMAKGYAEATVSEIVAAAGISREVFYAHFANKQSAYLAAQQFATQYILEGCTAAYFKRNTWPERVWSALDALIGMLVANPALAHLRLVECYAAGPAAIEQTEQLKRAATIFLQEGFNCLPRPSSVPPLAMHAIAGAVFEVFYTHISQGELAELPRSLPQLSYMAIAPFMGTKRAIAAIDEIRDGAVAG
jgi:AcrR family transcriptional regulator